MKFQHRRQQVEGEFALRKGGFSATPPPTPPVINPGDMNGLSEAKGELGDFSTTLCVETDNNIQNCKYINRPLTGGAPIIQTPPEALESRHKCFQLNEINRGGVCAETPPAKAIVDIAGGMRDDITEGLRLLSRRRAPTITRPGVWAEIVSDAAKLTADGWARRALDVGWDAYDLFGIGRQGSAQWESLAVWLAGRTITVIDDHQARTTCGGIYYLERWGRADTAFDQPIFLWEWAR